MQTAVKQQRCFVCDNIVTDKCISLLSSKTPLTKVWLPHKIGSIVGDGYAVYVNYDDGLCPSCWNIFKQLDSYENNVEVLKTTILQHLRKKYSNEFQKENIKKTTAIGNLEHASKVTSPKTYTSTDKIPHWVNSGCRTDEPEAKRAKTGPTFRCSECSFKDGDLNVLRKHITVCEKMTNCKYCNVRISIKNLAKHCSAMHSLFVCKVCNYRASDRNALLSHMKVNHAMSQYEGRTIARATVGDQTAASTGRLACTACDFVTDSNEALNAHKHTHGKIFKCNKCSQHYDNFEAIKEHAKVHKKVTIYKCGICSATYKDRTQFMQHIVVHVDGKTAKTGTGAATAAASTVDTYPVGQQQQQQQSQSDTSTLMISESAGDLESLLEKISSGTTVNMVPATTSSTAAAAAATTADVASATGTTTAVLKDDGGDEQEVRIAFKCQMCNEVFATSNEYQLHVITACHGQVELNIDDENSDIKLVTNDNGRKQLLMPNGELLDITDADGVFETGDVVMTTSTTTETTAEAAVGTEGATEAATASVADGAVDDTTAVLATEQGSDEQTGDSVMTDAAVTEAAATGDQEPQPRVLDMVSIADDAELEAVTPAAINESAATDASTANTNGKDGIDGHATVAETVDSATGDAAAAADCPMDIDEIEEDSTVAADDNTDAAAAVAATDEQQPDDNKSKSKSGSKSNKKN